jgi:hypothetical protein
MARGSAGTVTWGDVMLRKRDGTMGVHACETDAVPRLGRHRPPFASIFQASLPAYTDPCHPSTGRKPPEKKVCKGKKIRTKQKFCGPVFSRHDRPATCTIPNMVVGLVCVADDGGLFSHVFSLDRSLLVGWVGFGREQHMRYQCLQQTRQKSRYVEVLGKDGGPKKQQLYRFDLNAN